MLPHHKVDSLTRSVSSLTLDGRRLTAELTVALTRAVNRSDAETIGSEIAGIVDDILGAQIVQGQPPLTASDLEVMTHARTKSLGKVAKVRIVGLRLSVPPSAQAPSMRPAVSTRPPENRTPTSSTPPASGPRPGAYSSVTSRPPRTATPPPTSPWTTPSAPTSPSRTPSPPPTSPSRTPSPPPTSPSRTPSPPPTSPSRAPSSPPNLDSTGQALASPLRDSAAQAVISVLSVVPVTVDRLALLEGKPPAEALRREVCACFSASIYRASLAIGESHRAAAAKVEVACKHAFAGTGPSATDIGLYIASDAPVAALATRIAALLGCEGDGPALRAALTSSHTAFGERLVLAHRAL